MKKLCLLGVMLIIFSLSSCDNNNDNNSSINQRPKLLFDAVSLLGKSSKEVNKILGEPYLVHPMNSKTSPNDKAYYNFYKIEKDASVFFDPENLGDKALVILVVFLDKSKTLSDATLSLGLDLSKFKPTRISNFDIGKEQVYNDISITGKKISVYYFKAKDDGEVTVKIGRGPFG